MRKFLPAALCALAAIAYAQCGAAADPNATLDPARGPVSGADARGAANPGAPTASDNARPEKRSADAAAGGTQDSSQKTETKKQKRIRKAPRNERSTDDSNTGPTTGGRY